MRNDVVHVITNNVHGHDPINTQFLLSSTFLGIRLYYKEQQISKWNTLSHWKLALVQAQGKGKLLPGMTVNPSQNIDALSRFEWVGHDQVGTK